MPSLWWQERRCKELGFPLVPLVFGVSLSKVGGETVFWWNITCGAYWEGEG